MLKGIKIKWKKQDVEMSKGIIAGEMDNRLRRLFEIMTIELPWLRIIFREKESPACGIVAAIQ